MKTIGLDIGTTSICVVVTDSASASVLESVTVPNGAWLPGKHAWERLQDAERIWQTSSELIDMLLRKYTPVGAIGVTGQMHGIVYTDASGKAVSPLYTWQDGRGDQPFQDSLTFAEACGGAAGFGSVTHLYNTVNGLVPCCARQFCTIHDYVAMRLARRNRPLVDMADAASFGLFDVERGMFDYAEFEKLGMDSDLLPEVAREPAILGMTEGGVPVITATGDNQASFLGSVRNPEETALVNVGTGSQVSVFVKEYINLPGIDTRPFPGGGFLLVGAPLCGGRSYALLERFFGEVIRSMTGEEPPELYQAMETLAAEADGAAPQWKPQFSGTREQPELRSEISGISEANFTPGHFCHALLDGMAEELTGFFRAMEIKRTSLAASGNGIRKNKLLRQLVSERFGLPLCVPKQREEAAFGASLLALHQAGAFATLAETVKAMVQYEEEIQ